MPSFQHIPDKDKSALVGFLMNKESKPIAKNKVDSPLANNKKDTFPYELPYISKYGFKRFLILMDTLQ